MSAHVCGCDPDLKPAPWRCDNYPGCVYGRWEAQSDVRKVLTEQLTEIAQAVGPIERPNETLVETVSRLVHQEQPAPVKNEGPCVQDLVIADVRRCKLTEQIVADIETRKAVRLARYGTLLQPFNGRDALRDAYEENLDLVQYLRQAIEEKRLGFCGLLIYETALRMLADLRRELP